MAKSNKPIIWGLFAAGGTVTAFITPVLVLLTDGRANIALESNVKLSKTTFDELGENFEKTRNGFTDFLLLDETGNAILREVDGRSTVNTIAARLAERYGAPEAAVMSDVRDFLGGLVAQRLVDYR